MLVCSVSLRPPRGAIAAEIAEAITALDAPGAGNVVFATLIDDPASVNDILDAYLGEIMLEAASADAIADAGLVYAAAIDEAVPAVDTQDASVPGIYILAVSEPVTANSVQDATVISAIVRTALVANELSVAFVTPAFASVSLVQNGTLLTVQ